jgi:hypothetical protein
MQTRAILAPIFSSLCFNLEGFSESVRRSSVDRSSSNNNTPFNPVTVSGSPCLQLALRIELTPTGICLWSSTKK